MRLIAVLAALTVMIALSGCGSPIRPPTPEEWQAGTTTRRIVDRNYELGNERAAFVGESVIRVKDYHETTDSIGAAVSTSAPVELFMVPFGPRVTFPAQTGLVFAGKVTDAGETYDAYAWPHPAYRMYPVLLRGDGTFSGLLYNTTARRPFPVDGSFIRATPVLPSFSKAPMTRTQSAAGYTNFEIVYSGATRDAVLLLYREYTADDMARPAFTQQLTYERASETLRFRNIVLRVVEVTGERLRYVVVADGISETP